MNSVLLTVGIVVLTLVLLAIVFGFTFYALRGVARRSAAAAQQQYPNARLIDATANFWGLESRGVTQMRGNGTLILTDSELIFQQWVTNKEFRVPLNAIQSIETPTSFLGKTQGVKILKINFTNEGRPDAIAWRVRDLNGLLQALEGARGRG